MVKKFLTVDEVFEVLQAQGITKNEEIVRRWLRLGKLQGIKPGDNKKIGWRIEQSVLDKFVADRLAAMQDKTSNTTEFETVVLDENAIIADSRAAMWKEIIQKNIWEGSYVITKKNIKDALEHRGYPVELLDEVWTRISANSSAYKQPRVSYLLDAFRFEGQRMLMDNAFNDHERVLFPIIEYVRSNKNK